MDWWGSGCSFGWEFESKFTKLTGFGTDGNSTIAFLDDAVANAQAQTHALAHVFGGEERVKNLVEVLGIDAGAVIPNDQDALTRLDAALDVDRRFLILESFLFQGIH